MNGYSDIMENREMRKLDDLAKEGTNGVHSDKTVGIGFVVGKEAIRRHLRQEPVQVENL
jgi:hypothetical protein